MNLSIAERVFLLSLFTDDERVPLTLMKAVLDAIDLIKLSDEDKAACGYEEIKNEQGIVTQVKWNPEFTDTKDIEVSDDAKGFLKKKLDSAEVPLNMGAIAVSLEEKLS